MAINLRDRVAQLMVQRHEISPELAAYHVAQMTPREVKQRFLFYVSGPVLRVANGAIGNLTIDGMEPGPESTMPMPVVESFPGAFCAPEGVAQGEKKNSTATFRTV